MHVAGGFDVGLADIGGQRLDQGNREIARPGRGLGEGGQIEGVGLAGGFDRAHGGCGNHTRGGLGPGQGCLEIEHVLQGGAVVADVAHGCARQHRRKQGERAVLMLRRT